ncbi:hypothetical protein DPMN_166446 [Dreissena polymorpha]|uniref:Uncharacterized protein n=1 Tax=Dreissena polymorpha TaxID=45954 RepID=A0A9D4F279_DREPO|nr:hypothetical protein DPMN_166446 [Dreissena polymorpha]
MGLMPYETIITIAHPACIFLSLFRPGLLIRIGRITRHFAWPLSDEQELSPGSDLEHADQPSTAYRAELDRTYYATFCLAPFGRTRCTLTSRRLPIGLYYVLRDILPCTLTSRRLPIWLN